MEGCCPLFDQVEVIVYYIWVGVDDNTPPFHYSPYWFVCVLCADKWLSDAALLSFHVVISKGERHHES